MDSYEVMDNGQVMQIEHVGDNVIKSHFCMRYTVALEADATEITVGGSPATLTVRVWDWRGNRCPELDDDVTLLAINGQIVGNTVTSDVVGDLHVYGVLDKADAGTVVIKVKN